MGKCFCLLLTGLALFLASVPLRAQPPEIVDNVIPPTDGTYVPIPETEGNLRDVLNQRLLKAQGQERLQEFARFLQKHPELLKNKSVQELAKSIQNGHSPVDPNDPMLRNLEDFLKQQKGSQLPQTNLPSEQLKQIKEWAEAFAKKNIHDKIPETHPNVQPPPGGEPGSSPGSLPQTETPLTTPNPTFPPSNTGMGDEALLDARISEWLLKHLEKIQGPLQKSPAFQQALHDLAQSVARAGGKGQGGKDWQEQVSRLLRTASQSRLWSSTKWPTLPHVSLPTIRLPHVPTPRLHLGRMPMISGPHWTVTGPPSRQTGTGLLWLLVLLSVGFILWKLYSQGFWARAFREETLGWKLGPWPIDPSQVVTREDLVRAFDYLSLLKLGEVARSWNHREVATGLAGVDEARRHAADQLAGLYERARYAPADEPLQPGDVSAARHDLTLLAGEKGA